MNAPDSTASTPPGQVPDGQAFPRAATPWLRGGRRRGSHPSPDTGKLGSPPAYSTDTERWEALRRRDPLADGAFIYGVDTTGVFCRPGCRSRLPHRLNVRFFKSAAEAATAGYRPCKRCQPELARVGIPHADQILRACRLIEATDTPLALSDLAQAIGMSRYHFHRFFRSIVGVTPAQYAAARRLQRLTLI